MAVDTDKLADDVAAAFTGDGEPKDEPSKARGETGRVLAAALKSGDHAAIEDAIERIVRRCRD